MHIAQPTCYYSSSQKSHAVVVMDEVTSGRLCCGDSVRDLTYQEVCVSLLILARFHAKWWGAQDPSLSKLGRFDSPESGITHKFLMGGVKHFLNVSEFEVRLDEERSDERRLQRSDSSIPPSNITNNLLFVASLLPARSTQPIYPLARAMVTKVKAMFKLLKRGLFTLTHGDSRSDNFFYEGTAEDPNASGNFDEKAYNEILDNDEQDDDSSVSSFRSSTDVNSTEGSSINSDGEGRHAKAALCDFQMIMVSNPMRDYANFLVNSISPADRQEWNDKLVRVYHDELVRQGVDGFEYTYKQGEVGRGRTGVA